MCGTINVKDGKKRFEFANKSKTEEKNEQKRN